MAKLKKDIGNKNGNKNVKPAQQRINNKEEKRSKKDITIAIIIFIFSFLIYSNSIKNNYAFDDMVICGNNKYVQNKLHSVKEIFTKGYTYGFNGINTDTYRPITLLSMAFEIYLYGNKPHNHHFINVLLFSLSCVVLFLLLRKLYNTYNFLLPLIITLLYSAHPIHTEAVANIKSRDEILCFLFFVCSLYLMMMYVEKKNIFKLIISCIFYLLSLLSKENAITFFLLFPMVIFYFTKTNLKDSLIFIIPYFATLSLYLLIRYAVIDAVTLSTKVEMINNSLMSTDNYSDRLATTFSMLGKYLMLLIFPITLSCDYSYNSMPIIGWGNPEAFVSFLVYAGALVFAIVTFRKKNYFSFAILFFLITFSTTSNIFKIIGSSMAERFLFTPSLGFCIIIGLALVKLFKIDITNNKKTGLVSLYATLGIIIFLYSFKTINRNADWQDNDHLFKTDVQNMPSSFRLHNNDGIVLKLKSESVVDPSAKSELLSEAVSEYKKSIAIYPREAAIWYDLGVCYYNLKSTAESENAFKHCLRYDTTNLSAINDIGVIFFNQQNYDSAYYYFNKTLKLNPKDAVALLNIGVIMVNKGNYDEAIKYYERSVALNPNNPNIYDNLVQVYELKKDYAKADYYRTKRESLR